MKRIIAFILCVITVATLLCGCGKSQRLIYGDVNLENIVTLGKYKGVKVDTDSKSFKETYDEYIASDVEAGGFYIQKTEGTVAKGDTANIDYTGKKDGVAFDGGTAEGHDLEIGSGSFIPGFEDGLIGKQIGSTVDINLTFPEEYQAEDLAGKAVVFTVKINYVTTTEPKPIEQFCNEIGFDTAEDYEADVKERVINTKIIEEIEKDSKIKKYPEKAVELVYDTRYNLLDLQMQSTQGATLEQIMQASQIEAETFRKQLLDDYVYPEMKRQMIYYAILDAEKMEITEEDTDAQIDVYLEQYNGQLTEERLTETFGRYYFEVLAVMEKVDEFLLENAKIK